MTSALEKLRALCDSADTLPEIRSQSRKKCRLDNPTRQADTRTSGAAPGGRAAGEEPAPDSTPRFPGSPLASGPDLSSPAAEEASHEEGNAKEGQSFLEPQLLLLEAAGLVLSLEEDERRQEMRPALASGRRTLSMPKITSQDLIDFAATLPIVDLRTPIPDVTERDLDAAAGRAKAALIDLRKALMETAGRRLIVDVFFDDASVRSAADHNGAHTLADLCLLEPRDVLSTPGVGKKSLFRLRDALKRHGLALCGESWIDEAIAEIDSIRWCWLASEMASSVNDVAALFFSPLKIVCRNH